MIYNGSREELSLIIIGICLYLTQCDVEGVGGVGACGCGLFEV